MTKTELLNWLREEYRQWEAFLDQIGPERMEQPGVNGAWTMKDMVVHMNGFQPKLIAHIQAAQRGEPDPPPPWPAHLQSDDEINAWLYETNRERPAGEVLDETRQQFQQLVAVIEGLPDDVQIEPAYRVVSLNGRRFAVGEFFDHFHDDHEPDIRAWLARVEQ